MTMWNGRDVVITEGGIVRGIKIAGIFASEEDARSDLADDLAVAVVAWDSLTPEQQASAIE